MGSVRVPVVWHVDGQALVPAVALPQLLRQIEQQLLVWPGQGADVGTVAAVRSLLRQVADEVDVDCIELATSLQDEA